MSMIDELTAEIRATMTKDGVAEKKHRGVRCTARPPLRGWACGAAAPSWGEPGSGGGEATKFSSPS
jgi:hypothetical protein